MGVKILIHSCSIWVKYRVKCTVHPLIKSEEHYDMTDNFLPASTCKSAGEQDTYPRRQPNNWLCRHGAIKRSEPERTVKVPITAAKTHLGPQNYDNPTMINNLSSPGQDRTQRKRSQPPITRKQAIKYKLLQRKLMSVRVTPNFHNAGNQFNSIS